MASAPPILAYAVGPIADAILAHAGEVEVIATYQRSFYVTARDGIVAVVVDALGNGPINIVIGNEAIPPGAGIHVGMAGRVLGGRLHLGTALVIETAMAARWQPSAPMFWSNEALAAGLAHVRMAVAPHVPEDGLAPLIFAPASAAARTPTARAASAQIDDIVRRLPGVVVSDRWPPDLLAASTLLVGLGPGLTPSGDDVLGGVMLALSALRRGALRDALWDVLAADLDALTVPVSAMHLSAAADGLGADAMHVMISALLTGDARAIDEALPAVTAIGATSGLDALAGIVMTFDAHLRSGSAAMRPGR